MCTICTIEEIIFLAMDVNPLCTACCKVVRASYDLLERFTIFKEIHEAKIAIERNDELADRTHESFP